MQSFPVAIIDGIDLYDMGQKELSALIEKLTGRVTALEGERASTTNKTVKDKWGADRWIALGILVFTIIGLPIIVTSWVEPHLHNDLKNDAKIEVTDQLKEPLKQISDIAGDVKEIKGKLEVLDPLIRELTIKRIGEVGNLNSKELLARLPELRRLATTAKIESVTVKPEIVEKVGKQLVKAGGIDAWDTALDFLNYKSSLNASLPGAANSVLSSGILFTTYPHHTPPGLVVPELSIAGAVPREQAAQILEIGKPDPNASLALGNDWIIATGGSFLLDGLHLKKVILRNVQILYNGGPLEMQDVYFINCTFVVHQQPNGERLVEAVLEPPPVVNFKAS